MKRIHSNVELKLLGGLCGRTPKYGMDSKEGEI